MDEVKLGIIAGGLGVGSEGLGMDGEGLGMGLFLSLWLDLPLKQRDRHVTKGQENLKLQRTGYFFTFLCLPKEK